MSDLKALEKLVKDLDKRLKKIESRINPAAYALDPKGRDPLYKEAKRLIIESDNASASFLQRKMSIGYARSARVLDELQAGGVIGPALGAEPRKIFVKNKYGYKK